MLKIAMKIEFRKKQKTKSEEKLRTCLYIPRAINYDESTL